MVTKEEVASRIKEALLHIKEIGIEKDEEIKKIIHTIMSALEKKDFDSIPQKLVELRAREVEIKLQGPQFKTFNFFWGELKKKYSAEGKPIPENVVSLFEDVIKLRHLPTKESTEIKHYRELLRQITSLLKK